MECKDLAQYCVAKWIGGFVGLEKVLSSTNKKLFQPDSLLLSPLGIRKLANILGVMINSKLRSGKKN